MAEIKKISTELQLLDKFLDTSGDAGTSGQVLTSTGAGINWVSGGSLPGGPYLPLTGGTMTGTSGVKFPDNFNLNLGTSGDFRIFYNGNNAILQNTGGDIVFENTANDRDIFFKSDDGIGGVTTYFQLDGSQTQTIFYQNAQFQTNARLKLGSSGNLQMYHTSGISFIENNTGPLYIKNNANDQDIIFQSDNGSGDVTEYFRLDGSSTMNVFSKPIWQGDGIKSFFGNSQDLQIYHDGSNSYINDTGAGSLKILAQDFDLNNAAETASMIRAIDGAQVELYYGGSKKFETSSTGVSVTGSLVVSNDITATGDLDVRDIDARDGIFTGNVGIGTTSPSSRLTVSGTNNTTSEITLINTSPSTDNDWSITPYYNDQSLRFRTNSAATTVMTLKDNGNVGIGVTSPSALFQVNAADGVMVDTFMAYFKNSEATAGDNFGLKVDAGTNTSDVSMQINNSSGSALMRVRGDGNVGIGTTSPSQKLEVIGNQLIYGNLFLEGTANGFRTVSMNTVDGSDNQTLYLCGGETASTARGGYVNVAGNEVASTGGSVILKAGNVSTGNIDLYTANTQRMTIRNNGNVGIGTSSPTAGRKLDVHGDIELTEDLFIGAASSSRSEHKIKIGQNRSGNGYAYIDLIGDQAATSFYNLRIIRHNTGANALSQIIHTGTGNFEIKAANSGDTVFTNTNVGIGTTSPDYKLEVNGTLGVNRTDGIIFAGSLGSGTGNKITADTSNNFAFSTSLPSAPYTISERMRITNAGNVGIGTTSPGSSLEVLKSASSTTISEARISSLVTGGYGGQANLWLRTSTYGNAMLAFGPQVGSSTVASSASGKISYNTFTRVFTVTADSNALLTLGGSLDRVGINQTSPQYTLDVTGNGRFTSTVTATNFINSSDKRLKENIEEVCDNNVEVNWKTFNFKTEKQQKRYGVIAQELEKTNPEFVREDSQGFKSVAYIDLLIAKIAELEARIQKLEK